MACIWATNLELVWGVFAARRVVDRMTQWATRFLKPSICHRLTSTMTRSHFPRENGPATPLREAPLSPSPSTGIREQSGDPQPTPKTPLPNDMSTRDLSSDRPNANAASSGHDSSSAMRDTPTHVLSSNVKHKNRADDTAAPAPTLHFPNSWEATVPIHTPFSNIGILEKTRETTSVTQAHGLVSSVSKGLSSKKLQFHVSASMRSAIEKAGQLFPTPSSPDKLRTTMKSGCFSNLDQRMSSRSPNEPLSHGKGSEVISSPQGLNIPTTLTDVNSNHDGDNTSPTSATHSETQDSPQEETQNLQPQSDSVEWTAGRPDLLELRGLRYHEYRIRREIMWSWTPVMYGRLGARAEEADGLMCSNDTSDSEYVPSELDDTEREDESEGASHSAQEAVWESQSEDNSHEKQQAESSSQSEYGISEYHDDEERNSGTDSSEYWETEEADDEIQNDSEYASSNLWDDEVDRHTVPDSSEGEQSAYEENADTDAGRSANTDDQPDCMSTNNGCTSRTQHPQHGTLLKGADLERLRSMALSALRGNDIAELPVLQDILHASINFPIMWNAAFWGHRRFGPRPSELRDILVRDLNRCPALKRGDHTDTPQVNTIDFTFEELRCSPLKQKLICWFTDEDGDDEVQRRIRMSLLQLTEAPYCATVLKYLGLEDDRELWSRLGEQALHYVHEGKGTSHIPMK